MTRSDYHYRGSDQVYRLHEVGTKVSIYSQSCNVHPIGQCEMRNAVSGHQMLWHFKLNREHIWAAAHPQSKGAAIEACIARWEAMQRSQANQQMYGVSTRIGHVSID